MQLQWVYDFRDTKGVALGVIFNTEGGDAVATDIIVAGYPQRLKGKSPPVRTEKGIILGSTFSEVIKRYGYPPLIEIYAPASGGAAGAGTATGRAGTMRAGVRGAARGAPRGGMGGGMRGGMRGGMGGRRGGMRGGMGGRRGGRFGSLPGGLIEAPLPVTTTRTAEAPRFELLLTAMRGGRRGGAMGRASGMTGGRGGMRGGRGGMRGGRGGMRGGMRGGATARTRGGLPPLAAPPSAPGAAEALTAQAVVDHASIGFSRDCILTYESIAFTFHDMKVYRIHVSE